MAVGYEYSPTEIGRPVWLAPTAPGVTLTSVSVPEIVFTTKAVVPKAAIATAIGE